MSAMPITGGMGLLLLVNPNAVRFIEPLVCIARAVWSPSKPASCSLPPTMRGTTSPSALVDSSMASSMTRITLT